MQASLLCNYTRCNQVEFVKKVPGIYSRKGFARRVKTEKDLSMHFAIRIASCLRHALLLIFTRLPSWLLGCSKGFGQRLPWNIGLLLRKLWVVVCFHSRHLTICKHSCVRHISWAFCSAISGKQTMFTNHKAFALMPWTKYTSKEVHQQPWTVLSDTWHLELHYGYEKVRISFPT